MVDAAAPVVSERDLHARFAARILAYGRCHLRDAAAAQDLVQDVLLVTLDRLRAGEVRDAAQLGAFVLGVCRLTVRDWAKRERRRGTLLDANAPALEPAPWREPVVDAGRLAGCLDGLAPRERTVVTMTFYEDRDAGDVAAALGMDAGHVRVVRHRAIGKLRECMEGGGA